MGLNTRAGTARFIVSLQDRLPAAVMQKPAGELLKALVAALRAERSGATRKAFAGACGALCKAASAKRVTWLVQEALSMHATGALSTASLPAHARRTCKWLLTETVCCAANGVLRRRWYGRARRRGHAASAVCAPRRV